MNINLRKDELIKNIDENIKYLKQIRNTSRNELKKSLITLLTRIDKVRFNYLYTKLKYIIVASFNRELNNNYLNDLELKLGKLQKEFIEVTNPKVIEEEKSYFAYWFNKVLENISINKLINHLTLEKEEIILNKIHEKTLYNLGTLEEIDYYERNKYNKTDNALINKGMINYKISLGYLASSQEINEFVRELRNNFLTLIKNNKSVSFDNINNIYDIAYKTTTAKFNTEPAIKLSLKRMLAYLQKNNMILIDNDSETIFYSRDLYQQYYKECTYIFSSIIKRISYVDVDELERLFNICCSHVAEEMNYYPDKPISLKKVFPKMLKNVQENKMQK